jgi:hypothetical protein
MEKSNRRKRENQDTTRERRTLAEKTGFLSSLSLQLFFLFSSGVPLLSSKTDSFPQRKKTSSFRPANQYFVFSLHGQLTDFFSHPHHRTKKCHASDGSATLSKA